MKTLNGVTFLKMLEGAKNHLANVHSQIDALNVFPVPDGDTGTNMNLTFQSGYQNAAGIGSEQLGEIAQAFSKGLLMGARGNSGVILSQIFRGFAQSVAGQDQVDAGQLSQAFLQGGIVAYRSVMRPVEGTILTVIRESAEMGIHYINTHPQADVSDYFTNLWTEAQKSLEYTPELLPILKEVGVVDSGGSGLVAIFDAFLRTLNGETIEANATLSQVGNVQSLIESDEFGYCTEFIIKLDAKSVKKFKAEKMVQQLERMGNSLVVVQDEDLVKVHVHTLTPGDALNLAQRHGEFLKIKIENMTQQHEHLILEGSVPQPVEQAKKTKPYGIISVAAGEGLASYFKQLRVDVVISGGQTMNPSTEDFVAAIKKLDAKTVFVLPNNSNIILAAKQAAEVLEDRDIVVLETRTIPQGIAACIAFNPQWDKEENLEEINRAISHVKSGQVTYAIKDTSFDGIAINKGDFMGILEKNIVCAQKSRLSVVKKLISKAMDEEAEIVTLISGEGVSDSQAQQVVDYILKNYPVEVELVKGDQPVYSFLFGIE
ncbi:MAG: DAK2 domain-containing protein [Erysipelotrichaceae bacterium]|jgi:DAK2 domain fusion protein YloV|nr:DAK2 domain-containing protein [Erysipelotrichaceae bacterium]